MVARGIGGGNEPMRGFAAAVLLLTLSGCAEPYTQGTIKTGDQAISIAQKACDWSAVPGPFHARLERYPQGDSWFVWKGKDYRQQISVDANTGQSADGCVLPG